MNEAVISIGGTLGAYGEIEARLAGDFDNLLALNVDGRFAPGAALVHVTELSAPVTFDMRLEERGRGGALVISKLQSALGDIDGVIEWRRSRAVSDNTMSALNIHLADNYRPNLKPVIGDIFVLNANVEQKNDAYAYALDLNSAAMEAKIVEGTTDFRRRFAGDVAITFSPNADIALLAETIEASARADINLDGSAAFQNLNVARADGTSLAGDGAYACLI